MRSKKVYIFCSHTVPTEHPNAVRIVNIAKIFRDIGCEAYCFGFDKAEKDIFNYQGVNCKVWKQESTTGFINFIKREKKRRENIKSIFDQIGKPDYIVSCFSNCKSQRFLISYAKKNKIPMIQSICEWFDKSAFSGLTGFVKLLNNRYSMYFQIPRVKNVIAISSLLSDFYTKKGCNTLILPTLIDTSEYETVNEVYACNKSKICIAYAGSPAKKDYLLNIIKSLEFLNNDELSRLELHLYGPTNEQLYGLGVSIEYLERYENNIICHGRIPYEAVKQKIAAADFTVLLRPNKRYANAGFPTKVGESMACGTPVIANITSDLGKYIIDGETGIICENESAEACAVAIKKAINCSQETLKKIRCMTLEIANKKFNYQTYDNELAKFVSHL